MIPTNHEQPTTNYQPLAVSRYEKRDVVIVS